MCLWARQPSYEMQQLQRTDRAQTVGQGRHQVNCPRTTNRSLPNKVYISEDEIVSNVSSNIR